MLTSVGSISEKVFLVIEGKKGGIEVLICVCGKEGKCVDLGMGKM